MPRRIKLLIALAIFAALLFGTLILLRLCGLIIPFAVPTGAMAPAISGGDCVLMECITNLRRQPHFDSRFWGSVPRANILGRISLCYRAPGRAGGVK